MENLKENINALFDWAEQDDKNRSVICLVSEKKHVTEEGYSLSTALCNNGTVGQAVETLVDAMEDNESFANVIRQTILAYTLKHGMIAGLGIEIKIGKEASDE